MMDGALIVSLVAKKQIFLTFRLDTLQHDTDKDHNVYMSELCLHTTVKQ